MLHVVNSQINRNLLNAAAAEFPETDWPHWHHYDNGKLATHDESRIPPACGGLTIMSCSGMFAHEHGTRSHDPGSSPGTIGLFPDYFHSISLVEFSAEVGELIDNLFHQWGLSYSPCLHDLQF